MGPIPEPSTRAEIKKARPLSDAAPLLSNSTFVEIFETCLLPAAELDADESFVAGPLLRGRSGGVHAGHAEKITAVELEHQRFAQGQPDRERTDDAVVRIFQSGSRVGQSSPVRALDIAHRR